MNCLTLRFKNLKTDKMFYSGLSIQGHLCIQSLPSYVKPLLPKSLNLYSWLQFTNIVSRVCVRKHRVLATLCVYNPIWLCTVICVDTVPLTLLQLIWWDRRKLPQRQTSTNIIQLATLCTALEDILDLCKISQDSVKYFLWLYLIK